MWNVADVLNEWKLPGGVGHDTLINISWRKEENLI